MMGTKMPRRPSYLAAGQQRLRLAAAGRLVGAEVAPDHVADRIDADLVEAGRAHVAADLLGAGAVRVGQVGDGELVVFSKAGIAVLCQRFVPVPDLVAQLGFGTELVGQADLGDAVDVAQRLGQLEVGVVVQPAREGLDDLRLGQAAAARTAHRQDEGEAELVVVVGVELLDALELLRRAVGQAGLALLVGRFRRQGLGHHGLASQLRVGADQRQLRLLAGARQHLGQRVLELRQRLERPLLQRLGGDPGRVLVQAVEHLLGFGRRRGVELVECVGHW
jgi:hypothetical protein